MTKKFDLVEKYKRVIQEFVISTNYAPQPIQTFRNLLEHYLDSEKEPDNFALRLSKISDAKDLMKELNVYLNLKKTQPYKNSPLYPLIIAYFYYYQAIHAENLYLTDSKNTVQEEILYSLKLYQSKVDADEIRKLLEEMGSISSSDNASNILARLRIPNDLKNVVIDQLLILTDHGNSLLSESAWRVLTRTDIPDEKNNKVIEKCLEKMEGVWSEIQYAMRTLGKMKISVDKQDAVIEKLLVLTEYNNEIQNLDFEWIRVRACKTLGRINISESKESAVIDKLLAKTSDAATDVRAAACKVLGKMKIPEFKLHEVISKLLEKTADQKDNVYKAAYDALGKIKIPDNERDALKEKFLENIIEGRYFASDYASDTLSKFSFLTNENGIIERLYAKLEDENYYTRQCVCYALSKLNISKDQKQIVLENSLENINHQDYRIRESACKLLGAIDLPSHENEIVKNLLVKTEDGHTEVRAAAYEALGKVEIPESKENEVFGKLLRGMVEQNWVIRKSANVALGKMKVSETLRNEVIETLIMMIKTPHRNLWEPASVALEEQKIPEDKQREVIENLLKIVDSNQEDYLSRCDVRHVLLKLNIDDKNKIGIIEKMLEMIADKKWFAVRHFYQRLYDLSKRFPLENRIAILIKLDGIRTLGEEKGVTQHRMVDMLPLIDQFKANIAVPIQIARIKAKSELNSKLPNDVWQQIKRFVC
ncbi:MAG: HEAT repeat domain-containing protein [Gammaproteobacteria bacterium]|nr:HEAT repeat domain-containing protein [Gammaproteobacteria bacterium]